MLTNKLKTYTIMANERVISAETMQKLDGLFRLVREIVSNCNPSEMDTEPSFQKQFYEKAQEYFRDNGFTISDEVETRILSTQNSKCVSASDATYWKLDFLIGVDNARIPVELKLRHKGQDINGYAQDYIDDVDKVREVIINYDDCPECYVIMLTDNENLVEQCNNKASEYSRENNLVNERTVEIHWTSSNNYYIGIVSRIQTDERLNNPKGKEFEFLSDTQEEEFDLGNILEGLYNEDDELNSNA